MATRNSAMSAKKRRSSARERPRCSRWSGRYAVAYRKTGIPMPAASRP
jgi:hypothetical protein